MDPDIQKNVLAKWSIKLIKFIRKSFSNISRLFTQKISDIVKLYEFLTLKHFKISVKHNF